MAPETKARKRRGVDEPAASSAKKVKSATATKSTRSETIEDVKEGKAPAIRKRAADFFDAEDGKGTTPAPQAQEPKTKRPRTKDPGASTSKLTTSKPNQKPSKPTREVSKQSLEVDAGDVWASSEDDELEDQSAALLEGFGSSSDEEDEEEKSVRDIPSIPADKQLVKKLESASSGSEEAGVVYVGRIPHGFYEHQMKAYFSQFGDISRLRLSRNKKTGRSKHYAFIEFASREVAKIVAATMDKYLLFGHILQVRLLAPEEVHKDLFKGANKRFKAIPRNKIQGRYLRLPKEREVWEKRIATETKRRQEKEKKLRMLGYDFKTPDLLSTKAIPFREQSKTGDVPSEESLTPALQPKKAKSKTKATKQRVSVAS